METSAFNDIQTRFPDAERLPIEGSTCECYRVRLYGKLHFLKRLKPELATDPRYLSALRKEFETGYRLDHPSLARYLSCGDDYILMEYVDGETLADFLQSHPDYLRNRRHADRLVRQLLDVVQYLHSHQVLHLDLKPQNLLVTHIGHDLRLVDFGYCYTDAYPDTTGRTDNYAAPEQLQGGPLSERTDIYAIGRLLDMLPCASLYNKVIARCTQADPADRYQSVADIQSAVSRSRHSWRWMLLPSVLLLVVVGIVTWTASRQSSSDVVPSIPADTIQSSESVPATPQSSESAPVVPQPSISVPSAPRPSVRQPMVLPSDTPVAAQPKAITPPASKATSSIEQLREDIQQAVLPRFKSTLGTVEHPEQNDSLWMVQMRVFMAGQQYCLEQLVRSHPEIPVDVVVSEYRDYIQLLITKQGLQ